jgi:hypothetical protein
MGQARYQPRVTPRQFHTSVACRRPEVDLSAALPSLPHAAHIVRRRHPLVSAAVGSCRRLTEHALTPRATGLGPPPIPRHCTLESPSLSLSPPVTSFHKMMSCYLRSCRSILDKVKIHKYTHTNYKLSDLNIKYYQFSSNFGT